MARLYLDYETYSEVDLRACGAARYVADPSTEVLCAAYAFDDGPAQLWLPGEPYPFEGQEFTVSAHNAAFERLVWQQVCTRRYGWPFLPTVFFSCTAARCAALALPRSLAEAAKALRLPVQKDQDGKKVMMRLCKPNKQGRPVATPEELETLYAYCRQDVETERAIHAATVPLIDSEEELYRLDQHVNDNGIPIDRKLAEAAVRLEQEAKAKLEQELQEITGGRVGTGREVEKLLGFLKTMGLDLPDLRAATVAKALEREEHPITRRVLEIRRDLARASTAKFTAMLDRANDDDRVRGCHLFHGAATGRWSGMGIQPQNFPRPSISDPETAAEIIRGGISLADAEFFLGPIHQVLPSCTRSAICAPEGSTFTVEDFSQIEARTLAWSAGQQDVLDLFASGQDVYVHQAAKTYGIDPGKVTKDQRTLGKVQVLALGYGMGPDKFRDTCAAYGIEVDDAFASRLVAAYREANPAIVRYWAKCEQALKRLIAKGGPQDLGQGVTMRMLEVGKNRWAQIVLPSGRAISYFRPYLEENEWGGAEIKYQGINGPQKAYGGKIVENIVQAIASDLLRHAMLRLAEAGHTIVFHVHDEIACLDADLGEVERIVSTPPAWAAGLPIGCEGYVAKRYRK